jgi:hypothetical protein
MRAGSTLRALAGGGWDVHVVVVPVHGERSHDGGTTVARSAASYRVLDLDGLAPGDRRQAVLDVLGDPDLRLAMTATSPRPEPCRRLGAGAVRAVTDLALGAGPEAGGPFEAVHVLRLYLAPLVDVLLARPDHPPITLDVDEDDATVVRQLDALACRGGGDDLALPDRPGPDGRGPDGGGGGADTDDGADDGAGTAEDAPAYERLQRWYLPRVDRVAVASAVEAQRLDERCGLAPGSMVAVPNEVPARSGPPAAAAPSPDPTAADLLLVGNFSWPPNADAAAVLCDRVRPALAGALGRPVTVALVGKDPPEAVRRLGRAPGVTVTGLVDDVGPYYAAAGVAAVPMRAGGGSRIKLLEAMDRGVPVVTTTAGAAGLDGADGPPVAVADSVPAFVDACRRALSDPSWRDRTVGHAGRWVHDHHGPAAVAAAMDQLVASPARGGAR